MKRLRILAGRQVRDLSRKLERVGQLGVYEKQLRLMARVVKQGGKDEVSCIAKGKVGERKQYELGSKVSLASLPGGQEVVGVKSFTGNPHDSKPLAVALASIRRMFGKEFRLCDQISQITTPARCSAPRKLTPSLS